MKFRWTRKDLETLSDDEIIRSLLDERMSELSPYSFLAERLKAIRQAIHEKITRGKTPNKMIAGIIYRAVNAPYDEDKPQFDCYCPAGYVIPDNVIGD